MRLSKEKKNEILNSYNENIPLNEIIDKYKISRATYYRIIKDKSNNETILDDDEKKDEINNNDTIIDNDDNDDNNDNDNEDIEAGTFGDNDENDFDREQFKNELNNNDITNNDIENNNNISQLSKVSKVSKVSKISFNPKIFNRKVKNNINDVDRSFNNKSNVIDTIRNLKMGDIEEIKEKRHYIIIIRQYINSKNLSEILKSIYNNKVAFERNLFNLSLDQLKVILEDIRIQVNLSRNADVFMNTVHVGLKAVETISNYSGYDVSGLESELMNDPEFRMDLSIIACEIDISKYLNPKSVVFMKVLKKMYQKNKENEIKKQMNDVLNNKDKLNKIINLDKK